MASLRQIFLFIIVAAIHFHHAECQFSVLATGQVQIIKLLEEITTTSTPLVPNITALLTNQEGLLENTTTVLNEMNNAVRLIAAAQTNMATSLEQIVTLLQNRQSEDISSQPGQTTNVLSMPTVAMTTSVSPQSGQTTNTTPARKESNDANITHTENIPTDCSNISVADNHGSGVYTIDPRDGQGSFEVYCNMETDEGGWTVFQKRFNGSVDFNLGWSDYENEFGSLHGEHWLGLQHVHRLTSSGQWTLRVDLEDFVGTTGYAQYEDFQIGGAGSLYRLTVGHFTGNISDSLTERHNGHPFTTKDRDHDTYTGNCASLFQGPWWHANCHSSHLNGLYYASSTAPNHLASPISWLSFPVYNRREVLKKSEMKIRQTQ